MRSAVLPKRKGNGWLEIKSECYLVTKEALDKWVLEVQNTFEYKGVIYDVTERVFWPEDKGRAHVRYYVKARK